jgi:hypothetical protein
LNGINKNPNTRSTFFYGFENRSDFKDSTHSLAVEPSNYSNEFILKKSANIMEMDTSISNKRSFETYTTRCKAITDHESSNPLHLNFKQSDLIVVENKVDQTFWVKFFIVVFAVFWIIPYSFVLLFFCNFKFGYVEGRPYKKGFFPQKLVNMYV